MIEYSVDRATSQLTNDANRMSQSLLQRVQIVLKDTVLQIYKPDLRFKSRTCLHILSW